MPERQGIQKLRLELESQTGLDLKKLATELSRFPPADIAYFFQITPQDTAITLFRLLNPETAGLVLVEMEDGFQKDLIDSLSVRQLADIVDTLEPDDAADIYNLLPHGLRIGILEGVNKDLARDIRHLSRYDKETAGGIMTTNYVAVQASNTIREALDALREAEDLETDQIYVLDEHDQLAGVVSVAELLQEKDESQLVGAIMDPKVISVPSDLDQEEVVQEASTYGLSTVPVVNEKDQLIGIITADDLDQVAEEEASEDMYRMAGTMSRHPTKKPIMIRVLNRLPMLLVTILNGLLIAKLIGFLQIGDTPSHVPDLRFSAIRYLPIVVALAGNIANIENAIVVRGIATSEIQGSFLLRTFGGELITNIFIGLICATLTFFGIGVIEGGWLPLGALVSTALGVAVIFSAFAGYWVPVGVDRMELDPALTGPLVTALSDLSGTALYIIACILLLPASA